jgi:hypothetical protein
LRISTSTEGYYLAPFSLRCSLLGSKDCLRLLFVEAHPDL